MSNHLVHSNSTYLLQHVDNPVEWYPWSSEALEKAKKEDKPIFLSIGYAACHWCHVMAHESFEDPETAAIMNEHFVNIKVDREERPDLDSLYMNAVVALTGQGGWPMSVFLTPEGKPFYGGTYFPPERRYNMPAFKDVLLSLANTWKTDRERVLNASNEIVGALQKNNLTGIEPSSSQLGERSLTLAVERLNQSYDWVHGGWGQAPKFPQPMAIQFLLTQAVTGNKNALDTALHALDSMSRGGMYDVVGGGFSRYSTDNYWLVPHFEKMLYDNAHLARVYLHAYLLTGNEAYRHVCEQTIDFVLRELTSEEGGFYSSLDADSEGEEGKFYIWTTDEIEQVLDDPELANLFRSAYNLSSEGNFEGRIVLQRQLSDEELAHRFGTDLEIVHKNLKRGHQLLFSARSERTRPGLDDKVLVSWNALMLITLSEAGRFLSRADYASAATKNADFLLQALMPEDHLLRSWRAGQALHNAYLEDYAGLILGLVSLYQTNFQVPYIKKASELTGSMIEYYYEHEHGFFDTRYDHEQLFMRPKDVQDNATPSGSSLAVLALLQMDAFYGRGDWRDIAEKVLGQMQSTIVSYPTAFSNWLLSLAFAIAPVKEVAILGDPNDRSMQSLVQETRKKYNPHVIVAAASYPPPKNSPTLLDNRSLLKEKPTAYVCQNMICKLPVTETAELSKQIN